MRNRQEHGSTSVLAAFGVADAPERVNAHQLTMENEMTWGMGATALLLVVVMLLIVAVLIALIKYIFYR